MTTRALTQKERRSWLRLARTPRVGPATFQQLIARYQDAEAALDALPRLAIRGGAQPPKVPSVDEVDRERQAIAKLGGRVVAMCEPDFPPLLRTLDPPPPILTVVGSLTRLSDPAVAIVGARNASAIARQFARDIAAGVGEAGYLVVSGMARGIDAAAHEAALSTGTAAVLAGGPDHIYPPEHDQLYQDIIATGAIVTENPVGYPPTSRDFPRRNRLISGLSLGIVVIEAAARSGSLITARYAAEQGREVMAAPGSPLDPRAKGCNGLIRDGAALIESADDVVTVLKDARPATEFGPNASIFFAEEAIDQAELEQAADDARTRVTDLLSPSPVHRDHLVRESGSDAAAVSAALVELELAGIAIQLPGGLVARA